MKIDPSKDFRHRRFKLPKEAFATAPEFEPEPTDVIDEKTWSSIVVGPDDVSWRTTDFHGSTFRHADGLWGHWISLILDLQSLVGAPRDDGLCLAALLLADELQASVYCALTGFYRQAIAVLRFGLEAIVAGAYFRVSPNPERFEAWADGHVEGQIWMSKVRKALRRTEPYLRFESGTDTEVLFSPKGWIDFLYRRLSAFSHARPFFTDEDGNRIPTSNVELWGGSNGPIYEPRSVRMWSVYYFDVALCCLLLAGLAEPRVLSLKKPADISFSEFVRRVRTWHVALAPLHPVTNKMIDYLLRSTRVQISCLTPFPALRTLGIAQL